MSDQASVRRVVLALPEVSEDGDSFHFLVRGRRFAWIYPERIHPRKARVPNPDGLIFSVVDLAEKEALIASDPDRFFTTPHYDGFPSVIVWLSKVNDDELADVLTDAWRCRAPAELVAEYDAASDAGP